MYLEKRPTCVTVIGWVWIIIGGLMCFSSIMVLLSSMMMGGMAQKDPNMPFIFKIFPLLAIIQIAAAALGFVSGINFLKLKVWSRRVLEILSWLFLLFLVVFGIYWEFSLLSMTSRHGLKGFDIIGAVMGAVIISIYVVPLGIMLKYLRGDKVKNAMTGTTEPVTSVNIDGNNL